VKVDKVTLGQLDLADVWSETDEQRGARVSFPIHSLTGARASAVVYFEVDPGKHLGLHTDSAEEVVLILGGTAELVAGDERGRLETGEMAVVPALVPHDVFSVGEEPVQVVGWFASASVVSLFDEPFAPVGKRVRGTPLPEETPTAADGQGPVAAAERSS
jgi:quercetin dioxygenase-like cupin family protein